MSKNKKKLPSFNSYEEAAEFFDTHSMSDYWDDMKDVEVKLSPALRERLEQKRFYCWLGLSDEQIQKIEHTADQKGLPARQLLSQWILEHLPPVSIQAAHRAIS